MKKFLVALLAFGLIGCSEDVVKLNDHKDQIDANTAQIELNKLQNELQDLRLDSLDVSVSDLLTRLAIAEDLIDINISDISDLFDSVDILDSELNDLRDDFRRAVRQLQRADRALRAELRYQVRSLRRALYNEIRNRRLADAQLQNSIDDVEDDLRSFEARQSFINRFLTSGLFYTNLRISQLQSRISYYLSNINDRLDTIESDISSINSEISTMQGEIVSIQGQVDYLEDRMTDAEVKIAELCDSVEALDDDLNQLRGELQQSVRDLRRADRQTRRIIIRKVSNLRRKLTREIRNRSAADANLQAQIDDLESNLATVVYPCGEGNSEEVLLKTQDGLLAYFQEVRTETTSYSVGQSIPEHFVCDRFVGQGDICVRGHNVPASSSTSNIDVTHQVLVKAFLDILGDGNYRTTDGFSCNFEISNGEVLND